jgi:hypothetical protein
MKPCVYCKIPDARMHSLRTGGICDGIRNGKIAQSNNWTVAQALQEVARIVRGQKGLPKPKE